LGDVTVRVWEKKMCQRTMLVWKRHLKPGALLQWPFDGAVTIEEISKDATLHETFVIDNWCLLSSDKDDSRDTKKFTPSQKSSPHRFDYDSL